MKYSMEGSGIGNPDAPNIPSNVVRFPHKWNAAADWPNIPATESEVI